MKIVAIIPLEKALKLGDENILTFKNLASCYAEQNNDKAIALMKNVISSEPKEIENIKILSMLYTQFKDYKNAIKSYKKYLDFNSDDYIAYNDLGVAYHILEEYSLAEESIMKSININPDFYLSWYNLGRTYKKQLRYDEAIEVLLWSENLEAENISTLNELAAAYYMTNQKNLSLEYVSKSLAFDSNHPNTLYLKARFLQTEYQFSEAESFYIRAIEADENFSNAYSGLGSLYSLTNQKEKAIHFLNKSIKIDPSNGFPKDELARIYKKDKKYDLAIDLFKEGKQPNWEDNTLECLYCLEKYETFNNFLGKKLTNPNFSRQTSAILNHASIHIQNNTKNFYCDKPLDYIKYNDVDQIDGLPDFNKRLLEEFYTYEMDSVDRVQYLLSNGTQSTINIFDQGSDLFETLKNFLLIEAENYAYSFEKSNDGLITNWPKGFSLNGWLVNIRKGGFLKKHNHPKGWISGVYYLKIPKKNNKQEANIKFTINNDDFPASKKSFPEKEIETIESRLILFPSSLYHHTNLFTDNSERICLSFDFQPLES